VVDQGDNTPNDNGKNTAFRRKAVDKLLIMGAIPLVPNNTWILNMRCRSCKDQQGFLLVVVL
jgi:hypothetical protein